MRPRIVCSCEFGGTGGPKHVNLYTAAGDPLRTLAMPEGVVDFCFAYAGKYVVTRTKAHLCVLKATGEPILKFQPPIDGFSEPENEFWFLFSTLGARELWVVAAKQKSVWRFELP